MKQSLLKLNLLNTSLFTCALVSLVLLGCASPSYEEAPSQEEAAPLLDVEAPSPDALPELMPVGADDDWTARAHNKNREVIEVKNVIMPVAAYITRGFELHGDEFSEQLHEEWVDTQTQLTRAMSLYETCQARMEAGEADKQLFLDLEEVWQLLVKTGVAGVRTKSMVDQELTRLKA